jgi:hypothetical protein
MWILLLQRAVTIFLAALFNTVSARTAEKSGKTAGHLAVLPVAGRGFPRGTRCGPLIICGKNSGDDISRSRPPTRPHGLAPPGAPPVGAGPPSPPPPPADANGEAVGAGGCLIALDGAGGRLCLDAGERAAAYEIPGACHHQAEIGRVGTAVIARQRVGEFVAQRLASIRTGRKVTTLRPMETTARLAVTVSIGSAVATMPSRKSSLLIAAARRSASSCGPPAAISTRSAGRMLPLSTHGSILRASQGRQLRGSGGEASAGMRSAGTRCDKRRQQRRASMQEKLRVLAPWQRSESYSKCRNDCRDESYNYNCCVNFRSCRGRFLVTFCISNAIMIK